MCSTSSESDRWLLDRRSEIVKFFSLDSERLLSASIVDETICCSDCLTPSWLIVSLYDVEADCGIELSELVCCIGPIFNDG
jgi:hypothetical protein